MITLSKKTLQRFLNKKGVIKRDDYWGLLKDNLDLGLELRRPFEQRWLLNMAFFVGRQYTFFNQSAWILQQMRANKGRLRNVDNKILPHVRRQIADSIRNSPVMSVVPNTTDDEDIKAAKVGDKVLRSWWENNRMREKWRKLNAWVYICGNGFLDDRWNPKNGPIRFDEESSSLVYDGEVESGVWSPFEVVVPYAALGDDCIHSFPWIIKVKWRSLHWFENNFKRGKEVTAEDLPTNMFDVSHVFGLASSTSPLKAEGARAIEMYHKPSSDFPKGIHIIGANGIIDTVEDYPFTDFSMEQFKDIEVPGVFWGMATMELAIPLQKAWNRNVSGIDEFNRLLGKGKMLAPRGAKLEAGVDDTHGEILYYTPQMGLKPEIMTLKSLPQTYVLQLETLQRSMQDLFSQQEVSRGTNRSDIRSGEMVELLLEQNAIGNIPAHANKEDGLERHGARILKRIQQGYTNDRVLKITGDEGEFELLNFTGADLRNNTDVHVKRESSLPDSRVARSLVIERRFQQGFYGDPADPEVRRQVQNMLDDAIVQNIYDDTRADEDNSRMENRTMMQGGINKLLVNQYDNHGLHVKEHNHFRKTRDFQRVKFSNPQMWLELERLFTEHVTQHMSFLQEQMKAAREAENEGQRQGPRAIGGNRR